MRSLYFLALLLPLVVVSADRGGFWKPVNTSDPDVIAVAKFSVSEYNKNTTKKLEFQSLVSGQAAPILGTVYDLIIAAKNESLPTSVANYRAGVLIRPFENPKLVGFSKVKS